MKRIQLYGAGEALDKYLMSDMAEWINYNYEICGLIDKNPNIQGKQIKIGNQLVVVQGIEMLKYNVDIYITSSRLYGEIRNALVERGIDEERILPELFLYSAYLDSVFEKRYFGGNGVEIGGPSGIFSSIYQNCQSCDGVNFAVETVWSQNTGDLYQYKSSTLGKIIIADATDLENIESGKYDFVLSSNSLEHIANPIKAIAESVRILKREGVALFVVPNKEFTFDHRREFTSFDHILEDYRTAIDETDMTHLEEILNNHDLTMDNEMTFDEFVERSKHNFQNRCLHHHVFSGEVLDKVIEICGFSIIKSGKVFNCFYSMGRKNG